MEQGAPSLQGGQGGALPGARCPSRIKLSRRMCDDGTCDPSDGFNVLLILRDWLWNGRPRACLEAPRARGAGGSEAEGLCRGDRSIYGCEALSHMWLLSS